MNSNSNPIIALITDFGLRGQHYVASMKAIILKINPNVSIIDLSHYISSYSIIEALYILTSTYRNFPQGSIFIIVVDPGVGSSREIIALKTNSNYYFIGPNNGIFSNLLENDMITECINIQNDQYFNQPVSKTFHGRDIMAPVGAHLSNGINIRNFGPEFQITRLLKFPLIYNILREKREIQCIIQYIDSFGNGITNIPIVDNKIEGFDFRLHKDIAIKVEINGSEYKGKYNTLYSNVSMNSILFLVGSTGFFEISINHGNASRELSFKVGDIITIKL